MQLKLSEVTESQGFFTTYKILNITHFNNLFGELSESETTDLDNLLVDVYGDSLVLEKFSDIYDKSGALPCVTRLVKTCDMMFYEQWKKIKETIANGLLDDLENPLTETHISSQTGTNNTQNANTTTNQVYAFDSNSPSDSGKTGFSGSTDNTTKTESNETIMKSNGLLKAENAQKVIDFAKYNDFLLMLLTDIRDTVCLSIY